MLKARIRYNSSGNFIKQTIIKKLDSSTDFPRDRLTDLILF